MTTRGSIGMPQMTQSMPPCGTIVVSSTFRNPQQMYVTCGIALLGVDFGAGGGLFCVSLN